MSVIVEFVYQKPEIIPEQVMDYICNMTLGLGVVEKPTTKAEVLATKAS
jgi:hypothetical protein